jgi:hypothetical protein
VKILSATEYKVPGFQRKVISVVENPDVPEWIHPNGNAHTAATAVNAAGIVEVGLAAGTACHACRNNWVIHEILFTNDDLHVGLNKWGNPVHDGQEIVSTREKTWDEVYLEIDARVGVKVTRGTAPKQPAPTLVTEAEPDPPPPVVPPDFSLVPIGAPYLKLVGDDRITHRQYGVYRHGEASVTFTAFGSDKPAFQKSRQDLYEKTQAIILQAEADAATAVAIAE